MKFLPKIIRSMGDENIYLSFDDGPDKNITPRLCELLNKYGIKATFFMVGQRAESHPEIVLQIHKMGHTIGNHSYSHPRLLFKSKEVVEDEIKRTNEVLFEITGKRPNLFRPPHGQFGFSLLRTLKAMNQKMVLWNASSRDYQAKISAEKIQTQLKRCIQSGRIVLLHDGHPKSSMMLEALEITLEKIRNLNLKFSALLN